MADVSATNLAHGVAAAASRPKLRPRRSFDPMVIVWIGLAVVLIFLVANPLLRLVVEASGPPIRASSRG